MNKIGYYERTRVILGVVDKLIDDVPCGLKDDFNNPRKTLLQVSHLLNIACSEFFNLEEVSTK